MLIAELKAENYELKQRDKDYGALYNRLVDTEQRANLLHQDKERLAHEMRLRAESDALSITKLSSDNLRVWEDLANREAMLERLWKELDGLRGDADFKTLQVSKLTSELNAKGDLGATLKMDQNELTKQLVKEKDSNKILWTDLDRFNDTLRSQQVHHSQQLD